ncbi:MAG: hypothetical protein N2504_05460 [candidate division WOR-3 bacterium]|nr:hypothetical protein [candidate division WOR-3 bacterium]MCX7948017.1 hypothetical protein [candidate division WOR-3 bacterium]MDW8151085.1 hypothetical protein [candidate division WOR-3 bacterium]
MKSLIKFLIFFVFIVSCGKKTTEPEEPEEGNVYLIDIHHGAISLGPQSYWYVKFRVLENDSLYFEALVYSGNDISYAFWCDSINFEKWKNNENPQLRDYQSAILNYSIRRKLSAGVYYIVLGNSAIFSSKIYWARGYLRGIR